MWNSSFVHFAVGDLGRTKPLGSWILLPGSENKSIVGRVVPTYDVNADIAEVCRQQVLDSGTYPRHIMAFFIAVTKAQDLLGGCSNFTPKNPTAPVCWLCGKNRATILHEFNETKKPSFYMSGCGLA